MTDIDQDDDGYGHLPVMVDTIAALFAPAIQSTSANRTPVIVDCTLGAGGHTARLLRRYPAVTVVGIDRDEQALAIAKRRLAVYGERLVTIHSTFDELRVAIEKANIPNSQVVGVLFDLGVSSMQLDQAERGFSYARDTPLDMRMDPSGGKTAADLVNHCSSAELATIFRTYGDERFAAPIARRIIERRKFRPFTTTGELVELIYNTIPAPARRTGGHPAKRVFQSLRVVVNDELQILERALPEATACIDVRGRVVVMSYQSQEDALVKRVFRELTTPQQPPGLPMDLPGAARSFRLLGRQALTADEDERVKNPRSASVRVRMIERIRADDE